MRPADDGRALWKKGPEVYSTNKTIKFFQSDVNRQICYLTYKVKERTHLHGMAVVILHYGK